MIHRISSRYRLIGRRAFDRAIEHNHENIERALSARGPFQSILDLGCDDGVRTIRWARAAKAQTVHGVEVLGIRAALAEERGITVANGDLSEPLPYDEDTFDAVVSNQVIEHVFDTDLFLSEALRVLKPGGVIVTSTENLASWHNIASLMLGWQPFSLTNVSSRAAIGNPLALMAGGHLAATVPVLDAPSWQHRRVFATRGLIELHRAHGFTAVTCDGAGYYPLPSRFGNGNPAHAAFISVSAQRPLS